MKIDLRPYQIEGLEQLRAGVRAGHKRQILCAPTGSGKTMTALHLLDEAAKKFTQTAFICDRVALIDQTSNVFAEQGLDHGVIQANHWRFKPWERIQVCSVQTLARRNIEMDWKLIVIDEAHCLYAQTVEFLQAHPDVVAIGLTATPFPTGLGKLYSRVVNVTTTNELVAAGFLAPIKFYAAKPIDMSGAAIKSDGEWKDSEIEERGIKIVGDVVEEWVAKTREHFGGPVKTIVFTATVAHGEEVCRHFQAAGFNFQQVSYKDGNGQRRKDRIEEFRKEGSQIDALVSCEALAKGLDVPDIRCGIACKPYRKSLSGHLQQIGRVMRAHPGKEFALWLDHTNNLLKFAQDTAEIFERGVSDLSNAKLDATVRKEPTEEERKALLCGRCHYAMTPAMTHCPSCGWERPKRMSLVQNVAGELQEVTLESRAEKRAEYLEDKQLVWRQIVAYSLALKRGDAVAAERFALAQYRNLYNQWPRYKFTHVEPEPCSTQLAGKLMQMRIAYAKGAGRGRVAAKG